MNCQECQDILDNLLVAEPDAIEHAALAEHLEKCPDCTRQYAQARQALAAITLTGQFPVSRNLKERIMGAISDAQVFQPVPTALRVRRGRAWKMAAAFAAAVALLIALTPLLHLDPSQNGHKGLSAFDLLAKACAADENLFAGNQIVHLVNEIIIKPVADAALAQMRWLPLLSLEATGKPRFNQLTLPAEVDKGYTVEDQSWYDPATGRFVRVLTSGGRLIFANSYDGTNVYAQETPAAGPPQIIKHPITKNFQAPKSPAEFLGIAAGLRFGLIDKNNSLASDVGKITLDDGAEARVVKLGLSPAGTKEAMDAYWLVTIRSDNNNTIEKMEWFAQGKSLLVVRRGKTEPGQSPSMGWDLAGIAKQAASTATTPGPAIRPDMVISDVSVEQMVKKADFTSYTFSQAPSWAGDRQITDVLDVVSPPHRMFFTTFRAKDSRHVVLVQSFTYNKMLGSSVKMGKLVYTSPSGLKVWSGPRDEWLAKILLTSAQYSIKDQPGKELTGYVLETPAETFPALAINGKVSEEELHSLIDSLVPAK